MPSAIYRQQCCIFDVSRRFVCRDGEASISWRPHGSESSEAKRGKGVERSLVCISGRAGRDE